MKIFFRIADKYESCLLLGSLLRRRSLLWLWSLGLLGGCLRWLGGLLLLRGSSLGLLHSTSLLGSLGLLGDRRLHPIWLPVWTLRAVSLADQFPPSAAAAAIAATTGAAAERCARVEGRIQTESTASIFALFYNLALACCVSSGREAVFQPIRMKEKCFYFKAPFSLLKQV